MFALQLLHLKAEAFFFLVALAHPVVLTQGLEPSIGWPIRWLMCLHSYHQILGGETGMLLQKLFQSIVCIDVSGVHFFMELLSKCPVKVV